MKPLPEKFEDNLRALLQNEFQVFASSLREQAPVSIRTHPAKNNQADSREPVPWSEFGKYLPDRPLFTLDPLLHGGAYYVQEASSMFLEQALKQCVNLNEPLNILDLCAAPGGKSTHILSLMNRESLLVSNDVIRSRASILSENIQKWGYPNAIVTNNDPADFRKLTGFFDVVLVDAPCSGEGLFRKDPEAMDEWSPHNVQLCCSRQRRIVSDVWDTLKENGILIYCTCTYNEAENEENLKWLKENHQVEFRDLRIDSKWGAQETKKHNVTGYRFFPHRAKGEGFFLSVMQKKENVRIAPIRNKNILTPPPRKIMERLQEWILPSAPVKFVKFNDLLFYTPESKSQEVEYLLQNFKIVYAGTNVATLKHDKLVPDHAVALSVELRKENFPTADLPQSEAIAYLRRDAFQIAGASPGFTLITYKDLPIGWANVLSNRVNNMYPTDWRIRMKRG